jgi:hypothetical protein
VSFARLGRCLVRQCRCKLASKVNGRTVDPPADCCQLMGRQGVSEMVPIHILSDDVIRSQNTPVVGIGLHLNGRVANAKGVMDVLADMRHELIAGMSFRHH